MNKKAVFKKILIGIFILVLIVTNIIVFSAGIVDFTSDFYEESYDGAPYEFKMGYCPADWRGTIKEVALAYKAKQHDWEFFNELFFSDLIDNAKMVDETPVVISTSFTGSLGKIGDHSFKVVFRPTLDGISTKDSFVGTLTLQIYAENGDGDPSGKAMDWVVAGVGRTIIYDFYRTVDDGVASTYLRREKSDQWLQLPSYSATSGTLLPMNITRRFEENDFTWVKGYIPMDSDIEINYEVEYAKSINDENATLVLGENSWFVDSAGFNPGYVVGDSYGQLRALIYPHQVGDYNKLLSVSSQYGDNSIQKWLDAVECDVYYPSELCIVFPRTYESDSIDIDSLDNDSMIESVQDLGFLWDDVVNSVAEIRAQLANGDYKYGFGNWYEERAASETAEDIAEQ